MYTVCMCIVLMLYCTPSFYHSLHNISISFPIIIALHHGHVVCLLSSRRIYIRMRMHAQAHTQHATTPVCIIYIIYIFTCFIYTHIYYIIYILNPQKHFWSRSSASRKEEKRDENMIFTPLSRVIQNWYFLSVLIFSTAIGRFFLRVKSLFKCLILIIIECINISFLYYYWLFQIPIQNSKNFKQKSIKQSNKLFLIF